MDWMIDVLGFNSWEFFSSLSCPGWLWGPASLLSNGHWGRGLFHWG